MAVEEIDRLGIVSAHDGPRVTSAGLVQVRVDVGRDAVVVLISSQAIFALDVLEEGRKALVEPGVRPVTTGHEIAEPLVRKFVRYQIIRGDVERGPLVE